MKCIGQNCSNRERKIRYRGLCYRCYVKDLSLRPAEEKLINSLQKGWTRYGGVTNGYIVREEDRMWNCQACGLEQPSQISPSLFTLFENELLRICPPCQNTVVIQNISDFSDLIKIVR